MAEHIESIIAAQKDRPEPLDGRQFLLAVAGVVLRLALAQIIVNLLISATGVGLLNVAFYVYAVWLMAAFMRRTVAASAYTLKESTLYLQKLLGDSTTSVVEIPLDAIRAIRPVAACERLKLYYRQVTVIDARARAPFRARLAFRLSLFSAHLARLAAGKGAQTIIGHAIIYEEGGVSRCCVFRPDAQFSAALEQALPDAWGRDDRAEQPARTTLWARALQRAFPALYPYVRPLVDEGELARAREATRIIRGTAKAPEKQAEQPAQGARRRRSDGRAQRKQRAKKDRKVKKNEVHDDTV